MQIVAFSLVSIGSDNYAAPNTFVWTHDEFSVKAMESLRPCAKPSIYHSASESSLSRSNLNEMHIYNGMFFFQDGVISFITTINSSWYVT